MSRRSAFTCCMYHHACAGAGRCSRRRAAPPAGGCRAWVRESRISGSPRRIPYDSVTLANRSSTGTAAASPTSASRSPTAATSAASTACRPTGCPGSSASDILRFEEIERLVRLLARMGVTDLRLTGGEPLVRRDFPRLCRCSRGRGDRGPLAHHQRLPARARRGRAGRGRHQARQRLDRLAPARPLLPASPGATRCPRCCAASRRSPRIPRCGRSR